MPEIKNSFIKGRMNKDLDERLIPNGEYRDAMNVQITTSDGSDIGTVQNILGNTAVAGQDDIFYGSAGARVEAHCVGSIANEKTNKLYYFISNPEQILKNPHLDKLDSTGAAITDWDVTSGISALISGGLVQGIQFDGTEAQFSKLNQDITTAMANAVKGQRYRIKFRVEDYVQGELTGRLSSSSHSVVFPRDVDVSLGINGKIDGDGLYEYEVVLGDSTPATGHENRFYFQNQDGTTPFQGLIKEVSVYTFASNIIEYDLASDSLSSVVADTKGTVLKFHPENIITGINIIDNLLLWTDSRNEPKKINIDRCKAGADESEPYKVDTKLVVENAIVQEDDGTGTLVDVGLKEEHVTVVKKKPLKSPSFKINTSITPDAPLLFEKIFPRFSYRYKYEDGEYSAFAPFTDVVFNPEYTKNPNDPGTTYNIFNAYSTKDPFNTAMLNYIESIELLDFVSPDIPEDVVQIDLLYKKENSTTVYSIASIKPTDATWTNSGSNLNSKYTGKYLVESQNIYAALPEDQLLRPWDNVPKKALAQEITGNRVVYGNYTQGYDLTNASGIKITPEISASFQLRDVVSDFTKGGLPSVKSQRNYQLGFVFGDKYCRETPVFTSSAGAVKIPWEDFTQNIGLCASKSLLLSAALDMEFPDWAHYYKFYVKETSGEYYNLVMDRAYLPRKNNEFENDDDHLWLAFPSSDRNKVGEDDYIILKKLIDSTSSSQVGLNNKYKILDIKNEIPEDVKFNYTVLGTLSNDSTDKLSDAFSSTSGSITNSMVNADVDFLKIDKTTYEGVDGNMPLVEGSIYDSDRERIYVSWREANANNQGQASKRYRVTSIVGGSGSADDYEIKLSETISEQDKLLAESNKASASDNFNQDLLLQFDRKEEKDFEEFSGKFFVRISSTPLINETIIGGVNISFNYFVTNQQATFWNQDSGMLNSIGTTTAPDTEVSDLSTSSGSTITNTEAEWAGLVASQGKNFFIDQMHMVAAQIKNSSGFSLARFSGQTWVGSPAEYSGGAFWMGAAIQTNNHLLTNVSPNPPTFNYLDNINGSGWSVGFLDNSGDWGTIDPTTEINGLEGIITTSTQHVNGSANTIIASNTGSGFTNGYRQWLSAIDQPLSNAYVFDTYQGGGYNTVETGKHFIHLSFLAPGEDLHDGNWSSFVDAEACVGDFIAPGDNKGFASFLQGIWGGGIFSEKDGANFGTTNDWTIVEMEGSYVTPGSYLDTTSNNYWVQAQNLPGTSSPNLPNDSTYSSFVDSGIGLYYPSWIDRSGEVGAAGFSSQGYDTNYVDKHEKQWHPWWTGGTYNEDIKKFVDKITVGSKFKFSDDSSATIYTIKSVDVKYLYNHTPWRRRYIHDSTSTPTTVKAGDSVEEAAINWGSTVNNTGIGGDNALLQTFKNKIVDFGKANNRRTCYIIEVDLDPTAQSYNPIDGDASNIDVDTSTNIQFVSDDLTVLTNQLIKQPAIWETEAKEDIDLDIYYETSQAYPTRITEETMELFAPVGSRVEILNFSDATFNNLGPRFISEWKKTDDGIVFVVDLAFNNVDSNGATLNYQDVRVKFIRDNGSYTTGKIQSLIAGTAIITAGTEFVIDTTIDGPINEVGLSWHNCFSFGNGIESNRIRDDFNTMKITNGARASATLEEPYQEEQRKHGLIYSGLYNSTSGINNLNQFIQAEKITKDLNPTYGSIQKLFQRRISLVAFCEDKVVGITSNKDALFNADGSPQLISSSAVLGDATPFVGDYGISQNPESFASESYRAYFTDKQRGAVLRLSMDGLTPISDAGMHDYFRDKLKEAKYVIGTYDGYKKDYNLTLKYNIPTTYLGEINSTKNATVTYSEDVKGWTSFKSFMPESGSTLSSNYYTFKLGKIFKHHSELDGSATVDRNKFYPDTIFNQHSSLESHITPVFNAEPSLVKIFNTLGYEGSQSKIQAFNSIGGINDAALYNQNGVNGWYIEYIKTDKQQGTIHEFIEKEGKWFNYIKGTSNKSHTVPIGTQNVSVDFAEIGDIGFQGLGTCEDSEIL